MIHIVDKHKCCGCEACVQACPKECISLKADAEGFLYPTANASQCVECGLCERVCPVTNQSKAQQPLQTYAATNNNDAIRQDSSSGGIFTLLAEITIAEGGVVFGARFNDNWDVEHAYAESIDELAAFRGSKYLQSHIGNTYRQAQRFLNDERKVLFVGTPCQIAGLKHFLRKDYPNLLTVDIICHGAPSPLVWKKYLDETISLNERKNSVSLRPQEVVANRHAHVEGISFRNKKMGWKKYSFALQLSEATADGEKNTVSLSYIFSENAYMQAFLSNLTLRPSCYYCPTKQGKSCSDITLGDFWGIEHIDPTIDDDKGLSLVLINTEKGQQTLKSLDDCSIKEQPYNKALQYNPSIEHSVGVPNYRNLFMSILIRKGFYSAHRAIFSHSPALRIKRRLWLTFHPTQR